jgi:hypothetical protein
MKMRYFGYDTANNPVKNRLFARFGCIILPTQSLGVIVATCGEGKLAEAEMVDAEACRYRAQRIAVLANDISEPRLQALLYEMAAVWLKLAMELETIRFELDDEALGRTPPEPSAFACCHP